MPQKEYKLRPYQQLAVDRILWEKRAGLDGNSFICLPTGSGKSLVIAEAVRVLNQPTLILVPSKEILEQDLEKLSSYVPREEIGIYSASMDEKTIKRYTFATIQSVYKKPEQFAHFGLVIIDEHHLLNVKNLTGMFSSFLNQINKMRSMCNPKLPPLKVIGFSATPYRMDTGYNFLGNDRMTGHPVYEAFATTKLVNRMKGNFWNRILLNVNTDDLIKDGFLCPLEYIDRSILTHEDIPLNNSKSDFDLDGYEKILSKEEGKIILALDYAQSIAKSVLVFCSSVKQAKRLSSMVKNSEVVSAETPKLERENIIRAFRDGNLKVVFNVSVLTTGFDHPALDCIVLIRPTRSIALYQQMLGRGLRNAPGKISCKVIDLTSTVTNLGRAETIKLVKREKWELESETCPNWHGKELYRFSFEKESKKKEEEEPLRLL